MYEFVTGPLAWLSFGVFFIGLLVRIVRYIRGLDWQMDRVAYSEQLLHGIRGALRSIFYWMLPFGTRSWRFYPGFTVLVFTFHLGLLLTPIFLLAHNMLLEERWGVSLWSMPEGVSDALTIVVICCAVILVLRRLALAEVRILTKPYDILLIFVAAAPFVTGFFAYHHLGNYNFWLIAHILTGELMLIAVPLTKLSHFVLFFLSRAQIGMDYGIKRGGMKGKGLAW